MPKSQTSTPQSVKHNPFFRRGLMALVVTASFFALTAEKPAVGTDGANVVPAATNPDATTDKDLKPDLTMPAVAGLAEHCERNADIARIVATLLEHDHYLQTPLNLEMSRRWLKNYIQSLDPTHLFFLQSDIDEFNSRFGGDSDTNNLAALLFHSDDKAAMTPAVVVYDRFLERLKAATGLTQKALTTKFDFSQNDVYEVRTEKTPWFASMDNFNTFWKNQVKEDVLQNLLDDQAKNAPDKVASNIPEVPADTIKKISKSYTNLLKNEQEQDETDGIETYLNALCHAYDPHTDYFAPQAASDFQSMNLDVAIIGIGAELRSIDGFPTVDDVVAGGPADQDKHLQKEDRIVAVGQGTADPTDTVNMPINKVVNLIRGKKGTTVHLVVIPAGANTSVHKDIFLKRDKVVLTEQLAKAEIIQHKLPDGSVTNIGVIKLPGFYNATGKDVRTLLAKLKDQYNVTGIILDLRTDGGGLLDQALELTGAFAKHEPVVQVRSSSNDVEALPTDGREAWSGPLMVMVNKYSASASEIVAGALQDYGRAIIVGDKSTHGKGTVQTFVSLDHFKPLGFDGDPGKLKLTIQKFYRVAGGSTQQLGIIPDIILPSKLDAFPLGETSLPYCLPYDTIPPQPFTDYNLVAPYLTVLKKNSEARVSDSEDFKYLNNDVNYYKERLAETQRSLNFNTRLQQQIDLHNVWKKEAAAIDSHKASRDPVLELTLDEIANDKPAAPPVVKKPLSTDYSIENTDPTSDPTFDPQLTEAVDIMTDYTKALKESGNKLVETDPGASSNAPVTVPAH